MDHQYKPVAKAKPRSFCRANNNLKRLTGIYNWLKCPAKVYGQHCKLIVYIIYVLDNSCHYMSQQQNEVNSIKYKLT